MRAYTFEFQYRDTVDGMVDETDTSFTVNTLHEYEAWMTAVEIFFADHPDAEINTIEITEAG